MRGMAFPLLALRAPRAVAQRSATRGAKLLLSAVPKVTAAPRKSHHNQTPRHGFCVTRRLRVPGKLSAWWLAPLLPLSAHSLARSSAAPIPWPYFGRGCYVALVYHV